MFSECTSLKHSSLFSLIGLLSHAYISYYSYSYQSEYFEFLKKFHPSCCSYFHLYFIYVVPGGHRLFVVEMWPEVLCWRDICVVKLLGCFITEFLKSVSFSFPLGLHWFLSDKYSSHLPMWQESGCQHFGRQVGKENLSVHMVSTFPAYNTAPIP